MAVIGGVGAAGAGVVGEEFGQFWARARAPRLRTLRVFAEEEIVIPAGPFKGRRFRCDRQPYTGLLFDAVDSGAYRRHAFTGPVQSGKTLSSLVIIAMYHWFEIQEPVILGMPDLEMADEKWRLDFLPVIERTRYRDLIPTKGPGSRGGKASVLQFKNGVWVRFMGGGGGDAQRSGSTARVVAITEVDKMDEAGASSREADKVSQMEARTEAYDLNSVTYMECTTSIKTGRIWQEWENGTASRIASRCPHCRDYVVLGREHLVGWQDAKTELEAERCAGFACARCGALWSDEDRRAATADSILLHRGQEAVHYVKGERVEDGGKIPKRAVLHIEGDAPETNTLGFRWSAVDNMLTSTGKLGVKEWKGARSVDETNAEKELHQFTWALPYAGDLELLSDVDPMKVIERGCRAPHGVVPASAKYLVAHMDLGKWKCWYVVEAVLEDGSPHVVDYGTMFPESGQFGEDKAIPATLGEFREMMEMGYPVGAMGSTDRMRPELQGVDSGGSWADLAYKFCLESGPGWLPLKGYGTSRAMDRNYMRPKNKSAHVRFIGEEYHLAWIRMDKGRVAVLEVNADHWKSMVHTSLQIPMPEGDGGAIEAGAMTLFERERPLDHLGFAKHMVSEKEIEEFVAGTGPGTGTVKRWEQVRRDNHWLDCAYNCRALGHACESGLVELLKAGRGGVGTEGWFSQRRGR